MKTLTPGGEPFLIPGGDTGCLLIHGFTGTPFEMRGLGRRLAAEGYTVHAPRLVHHATDPADMNRSRWWDWYFSALDGWHLLNDLCGRVFVIGLSMGGLTALLLAACNPVAGVITMSAPAVHRQNKWQRRAARVLWPVMPLAGKSNDDDKNADGEETWPSYSQYPVRAVGELDRYLDKLEEVLPAVSAPALLMHAVHDQTVPPANLDYIYDHIGSTRKQKVLIERGGHVMTEDIEKEKVYQQVIDFLAQTAA